MTLPVLDFQGRVLELVGKSSGLKETGTAFHVVEIISIDVSNVAAVMSHVATGYASVMRIISITDKPVKAAVSQKAKD